MQAIVFSEAELCHAPHKSPTAASLHQTSASRRKPRAPMQGMEHARLVAMDQRIPTQRIIKIRRDYNTWVADETLEDYALRFTPRSFRKWSEMRVANTAFGAASFLVLEAVGATMLVTLNGMRVLRQR